jgi:dipeptidyl aminopeptidase/acylaminoacyl peptidase
VVDADLSAPRLLRQFPGDQPDFLAVSPDGSQLAFDLGDPGVDDNHVFVMAMDGTGLRQLTTSDVNEDAPAWSPDGRSIIVRWGIVSELFTCPELWTVPSDATSVFISRDAPPPAVMLKQVEDDEVRNVCAFSEPEWRAVPEPLPSSPGTPSAGEGPNAGLPGHIYYNGVLLAGDDRSGIVELDVPDGESRFLPLRPGLDGASVSDPFVTRAGAEVAFVQISGDIGGLDVEQVTVPRLDGTRTGAFEADFFSGQPKVSPDGQIVAIEWHDVDVGDDGGVPVVILFDRAGGIRVRWPDADEWDWLPDGRLLLASRNTLWLTNASLDEATLVAELADNISGMEVAPDGERIAFEMDGHVWTMGVDVSRLRRVTAAPLEVHSPAWSPDGRYLAVELAFATWASRESTRST